MNRLIARAIGTLLLSVVLLLLFSCDSKDTPTDESVQNIANNDQTSQQTEQTPNIAAVTFDEVLELWQSGQKDQAVSQFLAINWQSPDIFEKESIFTISESQFAKLSAAKRQQISQDALAKIKHVKELTRHIVEHTKTLAIQNENTEAVKYYTALINCGSRLSGSDQLQHKAREAPCPKCGRKGSVLGFSCPYCDKPFAVPKSLEEFEHFKCPHCGKNPWKR